MQKKILWLRKSLHMSLFPSPHLFILGEQTILSHRSGGGLTICLFTGDKHFHIKWKQTFLHQMGTNIFTKGGRGYQITNLYLTLKISISDIRYLSHRQISIFPPASQPPSSRQRSCCTSHSAPQSSSSSS